MSHIFVAVSGHGFGHMAQVAPVINALVRRNPEITVTLQSDLPEEFVRRRLDRIDHWYREIPDTGMVMHNALDVDAAASLAAYQGLVNDIEPLLDAQSHLLEKASPDLLIADIPFIPLLAAQRMGLRNIALCSLNWADILSAYCRLKDAQAIVSCLRRAYAGADRFIRTEPALPMDWLPNAVSVGPVIEGGRNRRDELVQRLGVDSGQTLAMINLGGIEFGIEPDAWNPPAGQTWLVPSAWASDCQGLTSYQGIDMPFSDIFASVDVVVAKPGYGTFTEAALNGIPVLTVERGDWPEEPVFEAWMRDRVHFEVLSRHQFDRGEFAEAVERLVSQGRRQPTAASGIDEAACLIESMLADDGLSAAKAHAHPEHSEAQ